MNLLIFILVSIACLTFLLFPYLKKSKNIYNDLQFYSELRRRKVLQELTSELENGTITISQFKELKEELFKIESNETNNSSNKDIDPIEKLIESKKNEYT